MDFERVKFDEIIYPWRKRFKIRFSLLWFILAILIISILFTSFYTIETNEVGVILRWGKFVGKALPGLHFKLPLGIDKVIPVKVKYIYKEEFGFRTKKPGIITEYEEKKFENESLMLTGDLNVLDVEWIVQFRIKDPYKFLFNLRNVRKAIRDASESVMRKIVGDYTFDEVLTTKRLEINDKAQQELQKILDSYEAGIEIITVKLQDVNPPDPVKPAFNEVNEAKQEKERMINEAWQVYNKKIPEAQGKAKKIIMEAEGYAQEIINKAQGDAERFLSLLSSYKKAKDITLKRLYLEYMEKILKKAGKKYIIDEKEKSILPLLQLEK